MHSDNANMHSDKASLESDKVSLQSDNATPRSYTVRDATDDDLGRILEITNEAIAHTTANWSLEPTTLDERREWFREHRDRGDPILVAEAVDGCVVGFSAYGPFRTKAGYRHTVEHSIYVDASVRGRGIGTLLLGALIERAIAARAHVMIGGIAGGNEASIRLHARFGFTKVAHLEQVGRKFDRWLDLIFVQRILTSDAVDGQD